MKKYIIGLFSAICLMGAGCTEFEDFTPVDMGEGPAVTVTAEKTAVDAFKVRRLYIGESCRKTQRERYAF